MKKWLCDSCCSDMCPEGAYPQEEHCEGYREATKYLYGMRLRGFSIGCQPMNGLIGREERPDVDGQYHDIIAYDRELTDKEVEGYELDFIGKE